MTAEMLFRYVMKCPKMGPFETIPEAFDTVGMRQAADVFRDRVIDSLMAVFRFTLIGKGVIGVQCCPGLGMVAD